MRNGRAYRSTLPYSIQNDIWGVYVDTLKSLWYAAIAF